GLLLRRRGQPLVVLLGPILLVTVVAMVGAGGPRFRYGGDIALVPLAAVTGGTILDPRGGSPSPDPSVNRSSLPRALALFIRSVCFWDPDGPLASVAGCQWAGPARPRPPSHPSSRSGRAPSRCGACRGGELRRARRR